MSLLQRMIKDSLIENVVLKSLKTIFIQGSDQLILIGLSTLLVLIVDVETFGKFSFGLYMASLAASVFASGFSLYFIIMKKKNITENKLVYDAGTLTTYILSIMLFIFLLLWFTDLSSIEVFLFSTGISSVLFNIDNHYFTVTGNAPKGQSHIAMKSIIFFVLILFSSFFDLKLGAILATLLSAILFFLIGEIKPVIKNPLSKEYIYDFFQSSLQNWISIFHKNIDLLLVRILFGPFEVALYALAITFNNAAGFGLMAINSNTQSELIEISRSKKSEQQVKIYGLAKVTVALSMVLLLFTIFSVPFYIDFLKTEYSNSITIFYILILGQIVNLFSGQVALLLNINNYKKIVTIVTLISLIIKLVPLFLSLNLFAIALFSSASNVFLNLLLLYFVIVKLKINPTIFFNGSKA